MHLKEYPTTIGIKLQSVNPSYIMAGPPNEYRTLRTINTLLLSGTGFSIAVKARKKTTRRKKTRKKTKENLQNIGDA